MCAHPRALSQLEVCRINCRSMCCHALCGYGYSTWMLQDDRDCLYFAAKKFPAREVQSEAKRSRKQKRTE